MVAIHSTTKSPWTWIRLVLLIALAAIMSRLIPYTGPDTLEHITPLALNIGILFSITAGFLMFKTLTRRTALDEHIDIELNKIRRIYHISLHIRKTNPTLSDWFARVRSGIITYLQSFDNHSFAAYEKGNPLFRAITYAVYGLPSQTDSYNAQLYSDLLRTTSQVTEARESIRSKKSDHIGRFSWFVVIVIALIFGTLIVVSTPKELLLRSLAASVMFCLFLVLQLIYEHDRATGVREKGLAQKYLNDLKALENAQTEY